MPGSKVIPVIGLALVGLVEGSGTCWDAAQLSSDLFPNGEMNGEQSCYILFIVLFWGATLSSTQNLLLTLHRDHSWWWLGDHIGCQGLNPRSLIQVKWPIWQILLLCTPRTWVQEKYTTHYTITIAHGHALKKIVIRGQRDSIASRVPALHEVEQSSIPGI